MRPRLVLADDHAIVAEGLRYLLESEFDLIGIVADGEFGAHGMRGGIQTHTLDHIRRAHEYSQPGYRCFTGPVFRPTA